MSSLSGFKLRKPAPVSCICSEVHMVDFHFSFLSEFLNVDDDEVAEDYDDDVGSAGETHLLENSGWSSRTRCVSRVFCWFALHT